MNYTYEYPRPAVTVDCLIYRMAPDLQILLIERKHSPFQNYWAIPGGFVEMEEDLIEAAHRELEEETGLKGLTLYQLYTFGKPARDPRGRVISVVFWGKCDHLSIVVAGDDAKKAEWFSIVQLPKLAFDHNQILNFAMKNIPDLRQ